ncbi:hypothetical protein [Luteibacter rhizovicinus]|uniref:hypothetical protein n=1 Tax=Luteibacter rhizovicinus TaxID=242606 RepID=UPI00104FDEF7|nr:hypothetical protein [Luteibacter rhizovicinus]
MLRRDLLEHAKESLTLSGIGCGIDALIADVERHADYLQQCSVEAEAVIRGNIDATTRLWLLLRQSIETEQKLPSSILKDLAGDAWSRPPSVVDGDVLLRLIAGVVRAANQPAEADLMLGTLAQWLSPLFLFEVVVSAAEQARQGRSQALETIAGALWADRWRESFSPSPDPVVVRPPGTGTSPGLDTPRAPFDPASWVDPLFKPVFDGRYSGWSCMGGVHKSMSEVDRFGSNYTIDSLSNPEACAGQTITIRGSNFGPGGRVSFASPDPGDPAFALGLGAPDNGMLVGVVAKRWTDTEIDVVVPVWATAGEIHLDAFVRREEPCLTIDVYRLGNSIFFRGGLASVYQVSIGGANVDLTSMDRRNLTPNDAVAITWHSSGGPTTKIRIQLMMGATSVWERHDLPGGFGGVVLPVPDPVPQVPTAAELVFTATSGCGATQPLRIPVWVSVAPQLSIVYVEVTQGVQEDLGTVLAGHGMPTVANKDTAVRVHMNVDRHGWYDNKLDRITGSLKVDGHRLSPTNVRPVNPDSGFAGIRSGLSNAQLTNETLNFTIPAAWLTPGTHTLNVQVVCNDPSGQISIGQTFNWTWVAKSGIAVRALYMAYVSGPSNEFMLDYARRALDFLPTPLTNIGIAAPRWYTHNYDLSNRSGWEDLLSDLEDAWDDADEASGVRWIGIVPANDATGSTKGISGTPSIAVLAVESRPEVGAHELGHSLGLNHVNLPVGGVQGPFDSSDNGGFLRRPPFDVRDSKAISLPAGDLMSYQQPVRPGISTWMRIFLNT